MTAAITILVVSWLGLWQISDSIAPPPHPPPRELNPLFPGEVRPHWNPATPYLRPGRVLHVPSDTTPGYIRRPIFEKQRLGEAWCPFPYNCVPGVVCPERSCVPGLFCCRSLLGLCCQPRNYTLTHYPPLLPPFMAPPLPFPVPLIHFPLPQHKFMVMRHDSHVLPWHNMPNPQITPR